MSDATSPGPATCARCDKTLAEGDRVVAGDRAFCRSCYETLSHEVRQAVARMSEDIPFPPHSVEMAYRVLAVHFGMMKLVFLAIVVYEAWVIPRPPKLDLAA